jgi:4-diphosphocytidyl-2-C-methyl-D-erythritol kinase
MTSLQRFSPCKVNLLLNILGRRADGYHELETIFQPVPYCDELVFTRKASGLNLATTNPRLPVDKTNLIHRAATAFIERASIQHGVEIHLEKRIPLEAGLGGGSANAAHTLLGLNELFEYPLDSIALKELAAGLGSDVVFFLHDQPAIATGRGEKVVWCKPFPALRGCSLLLVHPGFGVSTAWAYGALAGFPEALHGQSGRAKRLLDSLAEGQLTAACAQFYNAFEAPVFRKYPLLALYREFFLAENVLATLMSGSGSSTFALLGPHQDPNQLQARFHARFGTSAWSAALPLREGATSNEFKIIGGS